MFLDSLHFMGSTSLCATPSPFGPRQFGQWSARRSTSTRRPIPMITNPKRHISYLDQLHRCHFAAYIECTPRFVRVLGRHHMIRHSRWLAIGFGLLLPILSALCLETAVPSIAFSEHLIADKYDYAYGLAAVDVDGDGDLDLTSVDIRNKTAPVGKQRSALYWFENNGRGSFRKRVIAEDEPGWFERHAAGDIDCDCKPDVVLANNQPDVPGGATPQANLIWFANNARPSAGPWKRHVISTKCPRAYDVALADLDGDGRLDIAASGYTSNLISWYRNPGKKGWDQEWPQYVIDDKMPEARTIRAGDFNGDGKIDLLCTSFGRPNIPLNVTDGGIHGCSVVWYENPGVPAGRPWKKHIIDDRSRAPVHGHPVDMDGDGDLDVVMAIGMGKEWSLEEGHEIVWYENVGKPGDGRKWKRHTIGKLPSAFEA